MINEREDRVRAQCIEDERSVPAELVGLNEPTLFVALDERDFTQRTARVGEPRFNVVGAERGDGGFGGFGVDGGERGAGGG